jgi:hypothetical protein
MESLRGRLAYAMPAKLYRDLVDRLVAEKRVAREESVVRLPTHRVKLEAEEQVVSSGLKHLLILVMI